MSLSMNGRVAVITGAASGIGRSLALRAAREGMPLALADIDRAALAAVIEEVEAMDGAALTAAVDVRDRRQLEAFAEQVFDRFDSVALVFANAGVMRAGTSWLLEEAAWDLVIDVNLKGVINTAAAFIPRLLEQGARSRFVITGSTSAFLPRPHLASYSGSKHALWGIAEAMQQELAEIDAPVSVSYLAPSGVRTPIASAPLEGAGAEQQRAIGELLEAFGMPPEELAEQCFTGLAAERFWILPHPEFKDALRARVEGVIEERDPAQSQ